MLTPVRVVTGAGRGRRRPAGPGPALHVLPAPGRLGEAPACRARGGSPDNQALPTGRGRGRVPSAAEVTRCRKRSWTRGTEDTGNRDDPTPGEATGRGGRSRRAGRSRTSPQGTDAPRGPAAGRAVAPRAQAFQSWDKLHRLRPSTALGRVTAHGGRGAQHGAADGHQETAGALALAMAGSVPSPRGLRPALPQGGLRMAAGRSEKSLHPGHGPTAPAGRCGRRQPPADVGTPTSHTATASRAPQRTPSPAEPRGETGREPRTSNACLSLQSKCFSLLRGTVMLRGAGARVGTDAATGPLRQPRPTGARGLGAGRADPGPAPTPGPREAAARGSRRAETGYRAPLAVLGAGSGPDARVRVPRGGGVPARTRSCPRPHPGLPGGSQLGATCCPLRGRPRSPAPALPSPRRAPRGPRPRSPSPPGVHVALDEQHAGLLVSPPDAFDLHAAPTAECWESRRAVAVGPSGSRRHGHALGDGLRSAARVAHGGFTAPRNQAVFPQS